MADTLVTIGADLSQLRRELAKMPNLTGDAAQKTLIKLEKTLAKTESAAKKASKSVAKSAKASAKAAERASEESMKNAQGGLKSILELSGESGDSVNKVAEALGFLATPAGAAAAAIGAIAIAGGAASAAIFEAVVNTEQWAEELSSLNDLKGFEPVSPEALASATAVTDSLETLTFVAKQVGIEFGERFAPAIEQATLFAVQMSLHVLDLVDSLGSAREIGNDLAVFFAQNFIKSLTGPLDLVLTLADSLNELSKLMGGPSSDSISSLKDKYEDLTKVGAQRLVDGLGSVGTALMDSGSLLADNSDRARELINQVGSLTDETNKNTKALQKQAEAFKGGEKAANKFLDELVKWDEALQRIDIGDRAFEHKKLLEDIAAAERANVITYEEGLILRADADKNYFAALKEEQDKAAAETEASEKAASDKANALLEEQLEFQRSIDNATLVSAAAVADTIGSLQDRASDKRLDGLEKEREAIEAKLSAGLLSEQAAAAQKQAIDKKVEAERIAQLKREKTRALVQVAIDGALAITKAVASLPPPANIPAIVATTAAVAAQVASIASAPILHTGGVIQPDEVNIRAQAGESVLTKAATAALGEDTINRYNRGEYGEKSGTIVVEYNHQLFKTGLRDAKKRASTPLRNYRRGR